MEEDPMGDYDEQDVERIGADTLKEGDFAVDKHV